MPYSNLTSWSLPPSPKILHTISFKTWAYNSLKLSFAKTVTHHRIQNEEILSKYQTLEDTLEDAIWYVTLTILTTCLQGVIHIDNVTNLFEQCYITLMPINACMQQNHLIVIKYLILLILNKWKLENHQKPHTKPKHPRMNITTRCIFYVPYKGIETPSRLALGIKPNTYCNKYKHHAPTTPTLEKHSIIHKNLYINIKNMPINDVPPPPFPLSRLWLTMGITFERRHQHLSHNFAL